MTAILGFPFGKISFIFYLQVTPMFPIKLRIIWSFGSGEVRKIDF